MSELKCIYFFAGTEPIYLRKMQGKSGLYEIDFSKMKNINIYNTIYRAIRHKRGNPLYELGFFDETGNFKPVISFKCDFEQIQEVE